MSTRQAINHIMDTLPPNAIEEIYHYVSFLHQQTQKEPADITLASEKSLAKDWLLPVEDEAWGNL